MSKTVLVYSAAGSGGGSVDGALYVTTPQSNFSNLLNKTTSDVADTTTTAQGLQWIGTSAGNFPLGMARFVMTFDTSTLGSTAVVDSAFIRFLIAGAAPDTGQGQPDIHITAAPASITDTLSTSDFDRSNFGSTSFGSISYPLTSVSKSINFNASGKAAINTTGLSKFALRSDFDVSGSWTSTGASNSTAFSIYTRDYSILADRPYLSVTYSAAPIVTTSAAINIGGTAATGVGEVASDEGETITERGFCWSTSPNPTTADDKVIVSGTTGAYEGSITGLSASTGYHYRAYAINSIGTAYGSDTEFTTKSGDFKPKTFILT